MDVTPDISRTGIVPDTPYDLRVKLPAEALKTPSSFQGLFFEGVEGAGASGALALPTEEKDELLYV